jgi:FkbM family methyltransferase
MMNLALRKPALQSSVSPYSIGTTEADDARGGNNGSLSGPYGFHTATEPDPWWQVDLEDSFLIQRVVIFNRPDAAERLKHFTLLGSRDGREWGTLFCKTDAHVFGQTGEPFPAEITGAPTVRFLRVRLDGNAPLHFRECQVFGIHPDPAIRTRMQKEQEQIEQQRAYLPPGRRGQLVEIGEFAVFVDDENYDASIIEALKRGDYEGIERYVVGQLVRHVDRVIEVGTAIGVVAMTAARIAGAESVITFDANPDIVNDARDNFKRNRLEGIRSHVAILRNRQAITDPHEMVSFYIDKAFWASRLNASPTAHGIVRTAQVPIACLEDVIADHRATVLICDMEGGEVDLLSRADLSGIRLIIMETHYWAVGEVATDEMVRKLILDGFSIHLGQTQMRVLVLRRNIPR